MFSDYQTRNNKCHDCNLNFDTANQLQNHKRRFCVNSGYDNLQGLTKLQFKGATPPQRPTFSHKNHLQQYGSNSLNHLSEHHQLNQSNLNSDMKNIHRFKRQMENVRKYKHEEPQLSQISSKSRSQFDQTRLSHNSYSQSKLDEQLKRYQKPIKEEAISPPTFIDQLNMRNHTVLDKSNSQLGRMPNKDKIEYAQVKLDELKDIKGMYVQNGGNRPEFKANIQKMVQFYQKFLKEQKEKQKKQEETGFNQSQLIESRCSTPILKLRSLDQSTIRTSKASNTSNRKPQPSRTNPPPQPSQPAFNPQFPMGSGYPPMFMMPYAPPPQSNDSLRVLQKMMELKSDQNKQLMQILLEDRRRPIQPQSPSPQPSYQPSASSFKKNKRGMINVEQEYQFKKQMIDDLISEQKVLLALQQEEIDELKLLSQLPKQLQELKMNTVVKASQTRFQVQKQLLKQKMQRMNYQQQNQSFQQQRKLHNDRWAGEQRKKLLQQQVGQYLDTFEGNFSPS